MGDGNGLPVAAGIVAVGGLLYALVGEYSTSALLIAAVAGITGAVSFTEFDKKLRDILSQQVEEDGAFEATEEPFQDFDDIWESIQDWYGQDPRNGEIIWKPGVTKFDSTVPNSVDGKFRFFAMVTPSKATNQDIYLCIETSTKSLLTWDEKGEVDRNDLPGECQLVDDLRNRSRVSAAETRQRIMNNRIAQLSPGAGGSYAGFMGGPQGQKQGDVDLDLDDNDGGDDE